ncbi:MAG TPA: cache domain-containing protein [Burkholderiales bacterium]|nr:cache domain-containing protein [Burkholderiales bacterium]
MRSLLTKAMLIIAALIVLLWAAIGVILRQWRAEETAAASAAGQHMARLLAEYEASSLRAIDLTLYYLRADWLRDPASLDGAVARHREHLQREGLVQVAVMDAEGWTRYSLLPLEKPVNFADRPYFQAQKASGRDEMHVSEAVMGRVTKQWAIQFSRPIYDAGGRFDGVIVVALPPPTLELVYRDLRLGADDVITLVRWDGTVLARSRDLDRASGVSLKGIGGLGPEGPSVGIASDNRRIDGVERLYAYSKLPSYALTVYVGQSMESVLAAYYRQRTIVLGAGAVATLLLLFLGRVLASRRALRSELDERERRLAEQRERMMLELHDGAIQSIYAVGMNLERSREQVTQDPVGAQRTIASAAAHLNLVIQELRNFIAGLTNQPRGEAEFMKELESLVPDPADGEAPQFKIDVDPEVVEALTPGQSLHLLRIAREGVSNVLRHAYAAKAHISLQRTPPAGVRLEISDDGIGMREDAAQSRGLGLHHIGARGQKLSGRTAIESAPGRGTRIVVEFQQQA